MMTAWMRTNLTLCGAMLSGMACAAGNLPTLGSTPAQPAGKGDPETCHRLQQDFDIDLKKSWPPGAIRPPSKSPS